MAQNLEDFMKEMEGLPREPFKPFWFWNEPGRMYEVYWSNEAYLARWLNPSITLLVSLETGMVIGLHLTGMPKPELRAEL